MRFYSRFKSNSLVMYHAGHKVLRLAGGADHLTPIKTGMLRFQQIPPADTGPRISLMGNIVNGILDSEVAAEEIRKAGHAVIDTETKEDITEKEICKFLRASSRYGLNFVSIEDDETKVMMDEVWLRKIKDQFYCSLCELPFTTNRRFRLHCQEENHQTKVAEQGEHVLHPSTSSIDAIP